VDIDWAEGWLTEFSRHLDRIACALESQVRIACGLPPEPEPASRATQSDAEVESTTQPTPATSQSDQEAPGGAETGFRSVAKCTQEGHEYRKGPTMLQRYCSQCGAYLGESLTPAPAADQGT